MWSTDGNAVYLGRQHASLFAVAYGSWSFTKSSTGLIYAILCGILSAPSYLYSFAYHGLCKYLHTYVHCQCMYENVSTGMHITLKQYIVMFPF